MPKDKAKDTEITKTLEGDEKEFASEEMTVEGTKSDPPKPESVSIADLLSGLRKKGMKI